jgi:D-alanine-D-alanine ligase
MDIVVLAGGLSAERDVSLSTGSLVCGALRRAGHRALLTDLFFGPGDLPGDIGEAFEVRRPDASYDVGRDAPDMGAVRAAREDSGLGEIGKNVIELCGAADIVYMGLHGEDGENGRIQAFFDVLGIKYTGSGYLGSALAMHKAVSKDILGRAGVRTPRATLVKKNGGARAGGFPCVVKPCSGGSSLGVSVAHNDEQLADALKLAFRFEDEVLAEEYIAGREFSVGILGDTALPPIEIIPDGGFYDYAHKYQAGWTKEICPADLDAAAAERMRRMALDAHAALRLDVYSRGEFILDEDGGIYCLEMNTLPGMTNTSLLPQEAAAAGISYDELCGRIIALSMEKYEKS